MVAQIVNHNTGRAKDSVSLAVTTLDDCQYSPIVMKGVTTHHNRLVLAGIGRAQLKVLDQRVERKREIFDFYRRELEGIKGIELMREAPYGKSNRWLTCALIDPKGFGAGREDVRKSLDENNIQISGLWNK